MNFKFYCKEVQDFCEKSRKLDKLTQQLIDDFHELCMCDNCKKLRLIDKIYNQPERSKREDSQKCEMRCSEHCGNTVRRK